MLKSFSPWSQGPTKPDSQWGTFKVSLKTLQPGTLHSLVTHFLFGWRHAETKISKLLPGKQARLPDP